MRYFLSVIVLSSLLVAAGLAACSPVGMLTGAGAAAGVASAREGGISGTLTDARIEADISDKWFKYDLETFSKLNITVRRGRVLLTGIVQDQQDRLEAVRLAWQADGVEEVINEINVDKEGKISDYVNDKWIASRLRTAFTLDRDIQSLNYSIEVVRGIVYILGLAYSQTELNKVISTARTIPNVRQVVSYIRLSDDEVVETREKAMDATE